MLVEKQGAYYQTNKVNELSWWFAFVGRFAKDTQYDIQKSCCYFEQVKWKKITNKTKKSNENEQMQSLIWKMIFTYQISSVLYESRGNLTIQFPYK